MTCKHCCGADQLFDIKGAKKELKKYKKKGPGKSTRKLMEMMFINQDLNGKSLLDIGGGIGKIQWTFLQNGGSKSVDVDASLGYLQVAEEYATSNNFMGKASFFHGDFVDQSEEIEIADFVTLDKVICCYPDYKSLLKKSLEKCGNTIGVVYPLGGPISKAIIQFNKLYFFIKKNPFRTYIHAPKEIENFILDHGFKTCHKTMAFPWHVQVYKRIGDS